MTSYVVLLHRANVLPPCLSSRSSATRAVTALGAGTTQLKAEELRHRQLPPLQRLAICHAVLRPWLAPDKDESSKLAEVFVFGSSFCVCFSRFIVCWIRFGRCLVRIFCHMPSY